MPARRSHPRAAFAPAGRRAVSTRLPRVGASAATKRSSARLAALVSGVGASTLPLSPSVSGDLAAVVVHGSPPPSLPPQDQDVEMQDVEMHDIAQPLPFTKYKYKQASLPGLPPELKIQIFTHLPRTAKMCLILTSREHFKEIDGLKDWYVSQIGHFSANTYDGHEAGFDPPILFRDILRGWGPFLRAAPRFEGYDFYSYLHRDEDNRDEDGAEGGEGKGRGEWVWNQYISKFQSRGRFEEHEEELMDVFEEIEREREEKWERRGERQRLRVQREIDVREFVAERVELGTQTKMSMRSQEAEDNGEAFDYDDVSSLSSGEMEEIDEAAEYAFEEVEEDTDDDDVY